MALWILPKVRRASVCARLLFRKRRVGRYKREKLRTEIKAVPAITPQNNEEKGMVRFFCLFPMD